MGKETTQSAQAAKPVFSKTDLIANAEVLGYKPDVVVGALYNVKEDASTKDQLKEAVEKFLKTPIRKDGK